VAVDPASGDLYVADNGNGVVDKFDSSGHFLSFFSPAGLGVPAPAGSFAPSGVAVDAAGNVYVADKASSVVDEFTPAGAYTGTQFGAGVISGPTGVAVDAAGDVFVASGFSELFEFGPTGTCLNGCAPVDTGGTFGATFDPASGHLFVLDTGYVAEYDSSGALVDQFGQGYLTDPFGLAVNDTTGNLYVSDVASTTASIFGPLATPPDVAVAPATNVQATSATLNGTVNPNSTAITDCHFEYVDGADYNPSAPDPYSAGKTASCAATPSGSTPVAVSAAVSGLAPGTLYHFRLEASNASATVDGSDQTFATGAGIDREWVSAVSGTDATLNALVNPNASDTTYHFEYGTSTGYGTSVPVPDADIGSGTSDVSVTRQLTGLQAGTTYHYRIVTNDGLIVDGADHTFTTFSLPGPAQTCPNNQYRTGPSASLPDCRAWEQVSPDDKNGLDAWKFAVGTTPAQAAADGNGLMYTSLNTYIASAAGSALPDAYLAARSSTGWQTANVSPPTPQPGPPGAFLVDYVYSPDLSQAVYEVPDEPLAPGAEANVTNLFLRHSDGTFSLITTAPRSQGCPPGNPFGPLCFQFNGMTSFAGASADYGHVIFEANDCLTPDAPCGQVNNLYQEAGGQVSLVGYLPDGAVAQGSQPGSGQTAYLTSWYFAQDIAHAISADGSRIFFQAAADGGQPDPAQSGLTELYERINGSSTVEVSAPAPGSTPANSTPEPALYWGASKDGSLVLFTSPAELTTDANTGSGNAGNDLYEYNTSNSSLTDLSVDTNPADAATGANVQGVVGSSADGSYVYFVADGQLVPAQGVDGQPNLYLYHSGRVSFIGTLSPNDANDWTNRRIHLTSYVTPDGRHLALTSTLPLTDYDNTDQNTGQPDTEVYEYGADTGQLVCGSCDPTGAEPVGNALIEPPNIGNSGRTASAFYQPRVLSDDGGRLFFMSLDTLTPGAGSSHLKVYEYEHGAVSLLGAATGEDDLFLDASASGSDVFIRSRDQLVPGDQDQLNDVYDARVGGGFPAATTTAPCEGDACHGAPTAAPPLPVAATVRFDAPGNVATSTAFTGTAHVLRHTVSGDAFAITVSVPAAGTIAVSGDWVKGVRRSVSHAGSYRLIVNLTEGARRTLARRKHLPVTVTVRYLAGSGTPSAVTVHATFAARAKRRRAADSHRQAARRPR
jgi:hypothetical protein